MKLLKRFDDGMARGEAVLATIVLLSLVVVAAMSSFFRNMADREFAWANDALASIEWSDDFMKKATLWLAMFGASLATYHAKHIGIDVFSHIAKPKVRAAMKGITGLFAGVTCFFFAQVVLAAVLAKAVRMPGEWGVVDPETFETIHLCVASSDLLANADVSRPGLFCGVRGFFDSLGLTVNTPTRAMDLLVPAMFLIIAIRFTAKGIGAFLRIPEGGIPDDELEGAEKHAVTDEEEVEKQQALDDKAESGEYDTDEELGSDSDDDDSEDDSNDESDDDSDGDSDSDDEKEKP